METRFHDSFGRPAGCATGGERRTTLAYDADGNQTRVTTRTGRWRVEYNDENRPVRWTREGDGKAVAMTYDHMGRRRTKGAQRFFYDGYLQVANERTVSNAVVRQSFVWDPTEPVATRPLAWFGSNAPLRLYTHDGNKNVSEAVAAASGTNATVEVVAHYDYAAFGAVIAQKGDRAEANPWRFSSEYEDTELGLDYYNYRHYEPVTGRWLQRDPVGEKIEIKLYCFVGNRFFAKTDFLGLFDDGGWYYECVGVQYVYDHIPGVGFVCREECEMGWVYKKGHKDFPNNGTRCPFDYTKEDKDPETEPFNFPEGTKRHFRDEKDVIFDLDQLMTDMMNSRKCSPEKFQSLMHQLQDYYAHYKSGWRWWTLGHVLGGHSPDLGDTAQNERWPEAEIATNEWVDKWSKHCKLKDECPGCQWEYED